MESVFARPRNTDAFRRVGTARGKSASRRRASSGAINRSGSSCCKEMAVSLLIWLKPGEEVTVNGARIANPHSHKIRLLFNNQVRVLRERDRFELPADPSPGERLYFEAMLLSGGDMAGNEARLAKAIAAYAPPLSGPPADEDAIDQALCKVEHYAQAGHFYEA